MFPAVRDLNKAFHLAYCLHPYLPTALRSTREALFEGIGKPKAFCAPSPRPLAAAARSKAERGLDMLRIGAGGASKVPWGDGLGKGG